MKLVIIPVAFCFLTACQIVRPVVDEATECAKQGKEWHSPGVCKDKPDPDAPPGEPPVTPLEPWEEFKPGEYKILAYKNRIEFWVRGIDTSKRVEWHLWDLAHGRGQGETANAHVTLYDEKLLVTQQVYRPEFEERRHEDCCWEFLPDRTYRWVLDSDLHGYRLRVHEDGVLVIDMPNAQWKPWPVAPFERIDNIRIGCGTFSSHPCPNPIQIRVE